MSSPNSEQDSISKSVNKRKKPCADEKLQMVFKSPYVCFSLACQADVKDQLGPQANVNDVAKKLAETWKNFSPQEKAVWEKVSREDKEQCDKKKPKFERSVPLSSKKKRQKQDLIPGRPKRPMTAFLHYSRRMRPIMKQKYPDMHGGEITKLVGDMWSKNTDDKDREPFFELEKESRKKYKEEMEEWRNKLSEESKISIKKEQDEREESQPQINKEMAKEEGLLHKEEIQAEEVENRFENYKLSEDTTEIDHEEQHQGIEDSETINAYEVDNPVMNANMVNANMLPLNMAQMLWPQNQGIVLVNQPRIPHAGLVLHTEPSIGMVPMRPSQIPAQQLLVLPANIQRVLQHHFLRDPRLR